MIKELTFHVFWKTPKYGERLLTSGQWDAHTLASPIPLHELGTPFSLFSRSSFAVWGEQTSLKGNMVFPFSQISYEGFFSLEVHVQDFAYCASFPLLWAVIDSVIETGWTVCYRGVNTRQGNFCSLHHMLTIRNWTRHITCSDFLFSIYKYFIYIYIHADMHIYYINIYLGMK